MSFRIRSCSLLFPGCKRTQPVFSCVLMLLRWLLILHLLRRRLRLRLRKSVTLVGAENLNLHAAVFSARSASMAVIYGLLLAKSDHVDAVNGNVMLGHQVFGHAIGPFAAEHFVILARSGAVRETFYGDEVPLVLGGIRHQGVEILAVLGGKRVLVEGERDRQIADLLVIVQIGNHLPQTLDLFGVLGCQIRRLASLGHGALRAVLGCQSLFLRGTDAVLGLLVHPVDARRQLGAGLLDLLAVLGSLIADLIDLSLDRRRCVLHVFLGCATACEERRRQKTCTEKTSCHIYSRRVAVQFYRRSEIGAVVFCTYFLVAQPPVRSVAARRPALRKLRVIFTPGAWRCNSTADQ